MADPAGGPNFGGENMRPDQERIISAPRWVKVFAIIALVVLVLFVILLVTGGPGRHGPGRHTGDLGRHLPPTGATESGVHLP